MFALRSINPLTGNAILYGGRIGLKLVTSETDGDIRDCNVLFVETDFGNHLTVSWAELEKMWEIAWPMEYIRWTSERDALREKPNCAGINVRANQSTPTSQFVLEFDTEPLELSLANKMTARHTFDTFGAALAFFKQQPAISQLVSLKEVVTVDIDLTSEFADFL